MVYANRLKKVLDNKKKIAIQEKMEAEERAMARGFNQQETESTEPESLIEEENDDNDIIY